MKNSIKTIVLVIASFLFISSQSKVQIASKKTEAYGCSIRLNAGADVPVGSLNTAYNQSFGSSVQSDFSGW